MKHYSEVVKTKFNTVKVRGGKEYVEVKERLNFLVQHCQYEIETHIQYVESRSMYIAKATLKIWEGDRVYTYTGTAQEVESNSGVNKTSALENAETSAVGRACAMAGIGTDLSIASHDEIVKAQNRERDVVIPSQPTKALTRITAEVKNGVKTMIEKGNNADTIISRIKKQYTLTEKKEQEIRNLVATFNMEAV